MRRAHLCQGGPQAVWLVVFVVQTVLAVRVLLRLARTAGGRRIEAADQAASRSHQVSVIVPVLNEIDRVGPCLEGLIQQGPEVAEILVADGGSSDGTLALIDTYAARDARLRSIAAGVAPAGTNGKAHNLAAGLAAASADLGWVVTIDADVRPGPGLIRALLAHAERERLDALSVATPQHLSGAAEALIHPALLTTLVYRFGIPGRPSEGVGIVQANGQSMLIARDALERVGGFAALAGSICEDVTVARALVAAGFRVGFAETAPGTDLISVAMYGGWWDAWRNWTRSLPMRDRFVRGWLGLAEITAVQALPLPMTIGLKIADRRSQGPPALPHRLCARLNVGLTLVRLGVLIGTARAYPARPPTYWVSPVCDVPAVIGVWLGAVRRRHVWRGRSIVRGVSR